MSEVVDIKHARDVWVALEAAFSSYTSPSRATFRSELEILKRGSSSVADYGEASRQSAISLLILVTPSPSTKEIGF